MTFKFYINDAEVTPPDNWNEFQEELVRDDQNRHVYYNYPLELVFIGDGYQAIDDIYQGNYNSQFTLKVVQIDTNPLTLIDTIVKLSNCTFDLVRKRVTCEIDDASYQAYIFANYKVKVGPGSAVTKNGLEMTPQTPIELTVFNPITGGDLATRTVWDVKDCFTTLINYISDNRVQFESTWYDSLPDNERLCILLGIELRTTTSSQVPVISLEQLFNEIWKKFNLYLIIENPLVAPIIRLEEESYLYGSTEVQIIAASNLSRSMDFEKLYNTITFGSQTFIREYGSTFLLPYFNLFGFSEETYNVSGVIGADNNLNLVSQFVIDHNVIEDVIDNSSDEYDDDIFLIQYDQSTNSAVKGTYYTTLNTNNRFYNETLLNSNVASRFKYLGEIVLDTGLQEVGFLAERTTDESHTVITDTTVVSAVEYTAYPYNDDSTPPNYDEGADYDNTTFTFTSPIDGIYRFRASRSVRITAIPSGGENFRFASIFRFRKNATNVDQDVVRCQIFNSGDVLVTDLIVPANQIEAGIGPIGAIIFSPQYLNHTFVFTIEKTVDMLAGDILSVYLNERFRLASSGSPQLLGINISGNTFETIATPISGGQFEDSDPDEYYIGILQAENIFLDESQWNTIRTTPRVKIIIDAGDGLTRIAYPKQITRTFVTGDTDMELLFNRKQANL